MVGEESAAAVVVRGGGTGAGEAAWQVREWAVRCGGERVASVCCVSARDGRPLLVWLDGDEDGQRRLSQAVLGTGDGAAVALGDAGPRGPALARRLAARAGHPTWLLLGALPAPRASLIAAVERAVFQAIFDQNAHGDTGPMAVTVTETEPAPNMTHRPTERSETKKGMSSMCNDAYVTSDGSRLSSRQDNLES